ncbi:MAG: hypothetical protein A2007_05865 [Verrucomicrobia bacterium GWC2_42_7]|nr:MAG: hypothetical protein A2007_05865 [Verrucomicrobia bacterium GWC2_42_7]
MADKMCNVQLICGSDDFLVLQEGRGFYSGLQSNNDDFSSEILNGQAQNLGELQKIIANFTQSVQTLPMPGFNKSIWLKGINFLGDTVVGRSEGAKKLVAEFQEVLLSVQNQPISILLTASPVDRRTREYKWFQENVNVQYIEADSSSGSLELILSSECKKRNLLISTESKELFLQKVAGNTRALFTELDKVQTYLGASEKEITKKLILEIVCDYGEENFFEVCDAFYSGKIDDVLAAIQRYFFNNKESRPLMAAMQNRNRLLIQLKVLMDSGFLQLSPRGGFSKQEFEKATAAYEEVFASVSEKSSFCVFTQNTWYLSKLAKEANSFSLKKLIDFQLHFAAIIYEILKYPNEQEAVIRKLFLSCLV